MKLKRVLTIAAITLLLCGCENKKSVNLISFGSSNQEEEVSTTSQNSQIGEVIKSSRLNLVNKSTNNHSVTLSDKKYLSSLEQFTTNFANSVFDNKNAIFSPVSIFNCYGMMYEGTSDQVRENLDEVFKYSEVDSLKTSIKEVMEILSLEGENIKLDTSASFWISDTGSEMITEEYLSTLSDYYTEAFKGDFTSDETKEAIASWINDKTNNMFKVNKEGFNFTEDTIMALYNTIYLKSGWLNNFTKELNFEDEFITLDNSKSNKTFMRNSENGLVFHHEQFDIASLELNGNIKFNMLLPKEGEDYISVFKNNVKNVISYKDLESSNYQINYQVPVFDTKSKFDLKGELSKLGINELFMPTRDYKNMFDLDSLDPDLKFKVSSSRHEAGIDVNNDGIEAAAYTEIGFDEATSVPPILETYDFKLNRPFMYSITYRDLPLFVGMYVK